MMRSCSVCKFRQRRLWIFNVCRAPPIVMAVLFGASALSALCSYQRRGRAVPAADVKQTECGAEGIFWEAKP